MFKEEEIERKKKWTSLARWLTVRLPTKWLWVRIPLLSVKFQIWRPLRSRISLTFRQAIERRFTLKLVPDMIRTYSHNEVYLKNSHKKGCPFLMTSSPETLAEPAVFCL